MDTVISHLFFYKNSKSLYEFVIFSLSDVFSWISYYPFSYFKHFSLKKSKFVKKCQNYKMFSSLCSGSFFLTAKQDEVLISDWLLVLTESQSNFKINDRFVLKHGGQFLRPNSFKNLNKKQ